MPFHLSRRTLLRALTLGGLQLLMAACKPLVQSTATAVPAQAAAATTTTVPTAEATHTAAPSATPPPSATPTPSPEPTTASRVAPIAPPRADGRTPPYDADDISEFSPSLNSTAEATADKNTGVLTGKLYAKVASNAQGAGARTDSSVSWTYTHPANAAPVHATLAVAYTHQQLGPETFAPQMTGGAQLLELVNAHIRDLDTGEEVTILIERLLAVYARLPLVDGAYMYQPCPVLFQPGHRYSLDTVLHLQVDVFSEAGPETTAWHGSSGGGGGEVGLEQGITVQSMMLKSMEPPWIQTAIRSMWDPAYDTWDLYEQALYALTGHEYFAAGALVRVSAGGVYDGDSSSVLIIAEGTRILRLQNCGLPYTISEDGHTAYLSLPPSTDLPLRGRTWDFAVVVDPEFDMPGEDRLQSVPVFSPVWGAWADLELAADAGSKEKLPSTATVVSPVDFMDQSRWMWCFPLKVFQDLFLSTPNLQRTPVISRSSNQTPARDVCIEPPSLTVYVSIPSGSTVPAWDRSGLTIKPVADLNVPEFAGLGTEPVVIVTLLDLWNCFLQLSHPILESQGLTWCANPPFIQLLQRLGESSEAWRLYLENLYYLPPRGGPAIKISDLPEELAEGELLSSEPSSLYVSVAGMMLPVAVLLRRRWRRWIRRILTAEALADLWAQVRPRQQHKLRISGHVESAIGEADDQDQYEYTVFLDLVPRLQPWSLAMPVV